MNQFTTLALAKLVFFKTLLIHIFCLLDVIIESDQLYVNSQNWP